MGKIFTFTLAIAVCLGTTAMLASHDRAVRLSQKTSVPPASDAAFRDGLYVGKLAAEAGRPLHAPAGRWSRDADRTSFVAGFQRGYNETLASLISGGQKRRD
jgi:opacity protein-like surface antigen